MSTLELEGFQEFVAPTRPRTWLSSIFKPKQKQKQKPKISSFNAQSGGSAKEIQYQHTIDIIGNNIIHILSSAAKATKASLDIQLKSMIGLTSLEVFELCLTYQQSRQDELLNIIIQFTSGLPAISSITAGGSSVNTTKIQEILSSNTTINSIAAGSKKKQKKRTQKRTQKPPSTQSNTPKKGRQNKSNKKGANKSNKKGANKSNKKGANKSNKGANKSNKSNKIYKN